MNFLPDNYEIPQSASKYMKLEEGENTFRILSSAIVGYEWWVEDQEENRKPLRVKTFDEVPDDIKQEKDKRKGATHFWAFAIYNPKSKEVQILEIKQKTIMHAIRALVSNPKWGDPKEYDITITKTKTGSSDFDVEYSLMPNPKEPMDNAIIDYYNNLNINLNALYKGEDPFEQTDDVDLNEVEHELSK